MTYFIRITDLAWERVEVYSEYYEKARKGYGEQFEDKLYERILSLQGNPFQGFQELVGKSKVRIVRFPLKKPKFHHVIIFKIDEIQQIITILDIPHTSTDWKSRLQDL